MGIQLGGVLFVIFTNISTTSMVCWFVGLFVPLRFSDNELQVDGDAIHGEERRLLHCGMTRRHFRIPTLIQYFKQKIRHPI